MSCEGGLSLSRSFGLFRARSTISPSASSTMTMPCQEDRSSVPPACRVGRHERSRACARSRGNDGWSGEEEPQASRGSPPEQAASMTANLPHSSPGGTPRAPERTTVSNRFGTVTNLAVHYNVKENAFADARREDLIMRHVVAARLEISRHIIFGAILAITGAVWFFGGLAAGSGAAIILALVPLALAILLLWGSPKVAVTAFDGIARSSVSWPWTRAEADAFVSAVSRELMARGQVAPRSEF